MEEFGFTKKRQQLIVQMHKDGGLTFQSQRIYNSVKFYQNIKWCIDNKLVVYACPVCRKNIPIEQKICLKKDKEHKQFSHQIRFYKCDFWGDYLAIGLMRLKGIFE